MICYTSFSLQWPPSKVFNVDQNHKNGGALYHILSGISSAPGDTWTWRIKLEIFQLTLTSDRNWKLPRLCMILEKNPPCNTWFITQVRRSVLGHRFRSTFWVSLFLVPSDVTSDQLIGCIADCSFSCMIHLDTLRNPQSHSGDKENMSQGKHVNLGFGGHIIVWPGKFSSCLETLS